MKSDNLSGAKKSRSILIISLFALALIFFACSYHMFIAVGQQKNPEVSFSEVDIKDKYALFTEFVPPESQASVNGEKVDTETVLYYPDGIALKNSSYILDKSGEYSIVYSVNHNGNYYSKSYNFYVSGALYEITGTDDPTVVYGDSGYSKGVLAYLKAGEKFKVNKAIDFNGLTRDEPFLRFYNIPNVIGFYDGDIILTFTDADDPENILRFKISQIVEMHPWSRTCVHVNISANGGKWNSLRFFGSNSALPDREFYMYDDEHYVWEIDTKYGTQPAYSITGQPELAYNSPLTKQTLSEQALYFQYDSAENAFFVKDKLIMDLDDERFIEHTKNFRFTSGKAYLSIETSNMMSNSVNLVIEDIRGMQLSNNSISETTDQEIVVDTLSYDAKNLPQAVVNNPYRIYDAHLNLGGAIQEVSTYVYKNYFSSPVFVNIDDGCFVPDTEGVYYIVYKGYDSRGKIIEKVLDVVARKDAEITGEVKGLKKQLETGKENVVFDEFTMKANNGFYGNLEYDVCAIRKSDGKVFEMDGNKFTPMSNGDYIIRFTYGGYSGEETKDYEITVVGDKYSFDKSDFYLEKYYLNNYYYNFPLPQCYKLSSGEPQLVECKVKILSDDSSEELDITDINKGKGYKIQAKNKIKLKYYVENELIYETDYLTVINVLKTVNNKQVYDLSKYFATDGFNEIVKDRGYLEFSVAQSVNNAEFIRKVQMKSFDTTFTLNEANKGIFNIILTDSVDSNISIKLAFKMENGFVNCNINNGRLERVNTTQIQIKYANGIFTVVGSGGNVTFKPLLTLSGMPFKGFTSNYAFLDFNFEGEDVTGDKVQIKTINSQNISAQTLDTSRPQILYDEFLEHLEVGQAITLSPTIIYDVLDPNVETMFKVLDPEGNPVVSSDGIILDGTAPFDREYVIKTNIIGDYKVYYDATDSSGKGWSKPPLYNITVVDNIAPEIELSDIVEYAKVGKTIALAKAEVSDNLTRSEDLEVNVFVKRPDTTLYLVEGAEISFEEKGLYTVFFTVYDSYGNYVEASYNILVE